jgi:hypothetical protein
VGVRRKETFVERFEADERRERGVILKRNLENPRKTLSLRRAPGGAGLEKGDLRSLIEPSVKDRISEKRNPEEARRDEGPK